MKAIVFAYHDIGCVGLKALVDAGYDIQAVFTHTDSPNENRFFSSVARVAADLDLSVYAPEDVNHPLWIERIQQLQPDIIFSFYYRNMLSDEILSSAPRGGFNLHGSLLPKYRGRAPINWALVNGEKETGVTLHKMVKKRMLARLLDSIKLLSVMLIQHSPCMQKCVMLPMNCYAISYQR